MDASGSIMTGYEEFQIFVLFRKRAEVLLIHSRDLSQVQNLKTNGKSLNNKNQRSTKQQ